jgi:large subunit ribosomal protein L32
VATPKRRKTRSKRNMRRANHDKVTVPQLIACANCGDPSVPHRACPSCGFYKGKKVVETSRAKTEKAE